MEIPFNLILEDIIFGPLLILIMLTIALIFFFPFRKNHKIPFRFIFISWFILLMGSNSLFFKLFHLPLKLLTPQSEKISSDAIVVASAGVHESGTPTLGSALRAHAAAKLYLEGIAPIVIITGGVTKPYSPPVNIKGMAIILNGMGVPSENIIIENRSTDTYLNGVETTKILKRLKLNNVILVSHDYHLFRLVSVFEKLGINVHAFSENESYKRAPISWWKLFEWKNFNRIQTVAHEYLGLIRYKFSGWI